MRQELLNLREAMHQNNIDAYIIPTDDFHGSEYVGEHFKCRAYISGFTGSAGTLLVTGKMAGLWTDGRYFIQAEEQLKNTGVDLYKLREKDTPSIPEVISAELKKGATVAFDGRTMTVIDANNYIKSLPEFSFVTDIDLVGKIWKNRPHLPTNPARLLPDSLTGESRIDKINRFRNSFLDKGDTFILSHLPDIMWLLNIRGGDIECCPVVLSYCIVTATAVLLFADKSKFTAEDISTLYSEGVEILPYNSVYNFIGAMKDNKVLFDQTTLNFALYNAVITNNSLESANMPCPIVAMRTIKNSTEIEHMKKAHIEDGKAVDELLSWLRSRPVKSLNDGLAPVLLDDSGNTLTELGISEKIEEIRSKCPIYLGPSFTTIVGYAEHGAINHYSPTKETDIPIRAEGFVLIDTGGQYEGGTTDITRTVAVGSVTDEMQKCYDAVMTGHLALLTAKFPKGTTGQQLDTIARFPVWQAGYDYNHGTGHGVGYMLNVHECPPNIRKSGSTAEIPLMPGMISSDEPGIYIEGKFGIRTENMVLCVDDGNGMLRFESLTTAGY